MTREQVKQILVENGFRLNSDNEYDVQEEYINHNSSNTIWLWDDSMEIDINENHLVHMEFSFDEISDFIVTEAWFDDSVKEIIIVSNNGHNNWLYFE